MTDNDCCCCEKPRYCPCCGQRRNEAVSTPAPTTYPYPPQRPYYPDFHYGTATSGFAQALGFVPTCIPDNSGDE